MRNEVNKSMMLVTVCIPRHHFPKRQSTPRNRRAFLDHHPLGGPELNAASHYDYLSGCPIPPLETDLSIEPEMLVCDGHDLWLTDDDQPFARLSSETQRKPRHQIPKKVKQYYKKGNTGAPLSTLRVGHLINAMLQKWALAIAEMIDYRLGRKLSPRGDARNDIFLHLVDSRVTTYVHLFRLYRRWWRTARSGQADNHLSVSPAMSAKYQEQTRSNLGRDRPLSPRALSESVKLARVTDQMTVPDPRKPLDAKEHKVAQRASENTLSYQSTHMTLLLVQRTVISQLVKRNYRPGLPDSESRLIYQRTLGGGGRSRTNATLPFIAGSVGYCTDSSSLSLSFVDTFVSLRLCNQIAVETAAFFIEQEAPELDVPKSCTSTKYDHASEDRHEAKKDKHPPKHDDTQLEVRVARVSEPMICAGTGHCGEINAGNLKDPLTFRVSNVSQRDKSIEQPPTIGQPGFPMSFREANKSVAWLYLRLAGVRMMCRAAESAAV
ncbi:hypothetical protein BKA70DRAFT_1399454 [Coprinopsis sp. MPI-PUGE-AT-0042]|nr:hypothetical protein BKA70DRAFT_1399454 [Coprinopsis sp. MPI-PUGE-AT-0042]